MRQRSFEEISRDIDRLLASVSPVYKTTIKIKKNKLIKINTWLDVPALA